MGRFRTLLFALVAVLLFFAAVEGLLRLSGWARSPLDEVYSDIYDVEYVMSPGSPNPYNEHKPEKLNIVGLRGETFPIEREPGVLRVICLGDSTTFGMGELEECYPYMLQEQLEQHLGSNKAQVLNAGIPGTGFTQQLLFFQRRMRPYRPDVVALTGGPNYRPDIKQYRDRLKSERFQRLYSMRGWFSRFDTYRLLRRLVKGPAVRFAMDDSQIDPATIETGSYLMDYWEDLAHMRELSQQDGFKLVFLNVPHLELIQEMQSRGVQPGTEQYREVLWMFTPDHVTPRFAEKYGCQFVDSVPEFLLIKADETLFFDPNHPAAKGNRIIARAVAQGILQAIAQP
ncbi:MAG: GDSL-type esterase/lipase family protein [Candidatus Alcyoniella australis]|nr:GDSL-type esterase/lipase family protein [Candidatus Alcyoniella australis]